MKTGIAASIFLFFLTRPDPLTDFDAEWLNWREGQASFGGKIITV